MVSGISRIHDKLLQINDTSALFLTDKQLHFAVMGLVGMGLLLVIYPLFLLLSKKHVLTIAWIYVFTVMVVLSFAIEIGQGITNTGNMDLEDVISGLAGFMLLFFISSESNVKPEIVCFQTRILHQVRLRDHELRVYQLARRNREDIVSVDKQLAGREAHPPDQALRQVV